MRAQYPNYRLKIRRRRQSGRRVRHRQVGRAERDARARAGIGVVKAQDIDRLLIRERPEREQQARVDIAPGELALGGSRGSWPAPPRRRSGGG
ncbi:MAG: hypothetical protein ACRDOK_03585 [Streptosporangiaceae bacterium]